MPTGRKRQVLGFWSKVKDFLKDDPIYVTKQEPLVVRLEEENINSVLKEVAAERERQEAKWGQQNHHDGTGPLTLFLGARVPEEHTYADIRKRATDLIDWNSSAGRLSYADIFVEEVFEALAESDQNRLREELIQCAAVAVAWVEKIDRDKANFVPRKAEYLPGDLVRIHTTDQCCADFNGRHGVITYGPDDGGGWQVSAATGGMRVVSEELTMITRREDR